MRFLSAFAASEKTNNRRNRFTKRRVLMESLEKRHLLTTFFVTDLNDDTLVNLAGDNQLSLREALEAANTNASVDGSAAGSAVDVDVIRFEGGVSGAIILSGTQLGISDELSIVGPGADQLTIDANGVSRIFDLTGSDDVTLQGLTLTGGSTSGTGGAINASGSGGGSLTIRRSTISGNSSSSTGSDNGGGGVFIRDRSLVVIDSTISGNSSAADGGGISSPFSGDVSVINSTVSGNTADARGGGLYFDDGNARIINSTITNNTSTGAGGGIGSLADTLVESLTIHNSIIAGNTDDGSAPDFVAPFFPATSLEVRASLIGNNAGTTLAESQTPNATSGNIIGSLAGAGIIDPMLDVLGDNGGSTETHALLSGSPAIDTGRDPLAVGPGPDGVSGTSDDVALDGDQRGAPFDRIDGTMVDMGAYELQVFDASSLIVNNSFDQLDFNDAEISLREAILAAAGNPGDDTVSFDPSVTSSNLSFLGGQINIGDSDAITIQGNGADQTTINGYGFSRIFNLTGNGDVTFAGVTLTGGSTSGTGGAINASDSGGGSLTIRRSTIRGNSSSSTGSDPSGDNNNGGGGIFTGVRSLVVIDSTISGNSSAADGGGINSPLEANVTLINSTVSGNTAGARGGGLYFDDGDARIINSTITNNTAAGAGGGIGNYADGSGESLTIHNSIIAVNSDDGSAPDFVAPDTPATNLKVLASLIGDNTGTTLAESPTPDAISGNIVGSLAGAGIIDPMLDVLGDNGGPTRTHALLVGSPAIDTGRDLLAVGLGPDRLSGTPDDVALDGDQRGEPFDRIDGTMVDMGAYELQVFAASSLIVNISFDQLDFNDTEISLREAILAAAANPGDDTVSFDPSVTSSNLSNLGEINIGDSDAITIQGNGANQTTVDGNGYSRIFNLTGDGDVTFAGVTLTGGSTSGTGALSTPVALDC